MSTHLTKKDFLAELGPLGLTMRLRRVADHMVHQARSIYRELGLDIEPNWHAVLLLVEKDPGIGVADIARNLGIKHPSASVLVDQLENRGYIRRKENPDDGRRQLLFLTAKAKKKLPEFKRVWQAGSDAIRSAIDEGDHCILKALDSYEKAMGRQSFVDRVDDQMN